MTHLPPIVLIPAPRSLVRGQGACAIKSHHNPTICDQSGIAAIAAEHIRSSLRHTLKLSALLRRDNFDKADNDPFFLSLDQAIPAQGYRLVITTRQVRLTFSDAAGAWNGAQTLRQLIRQFREALPTCTIEDHPDFASRGVMLDISRDKVPTMETLYLLVDQLAEWKINRFELYTEHTFAYRNHREVWEKASPMTADEIRALDAFCAARFIELVPNQNSFGHMHRWLQHPRYAPLAEVTDGYNTSWGGWHEGSFSLNPLDPRSLALMEELFAELLPCFTSHNVNVGCDETFDLGQGRSKEVCERLGNGRVYLDYLLAIHRLIQRHGHTMHFWGDIILHHPELIPEIPRDIVPLVWGYEANEDFEGKCSKFAASGLTFMVCPGTSSWNSLVGRTDNALGNMRSASVAGLRHGATGYLNTDWGDNGHWQPYSISLLPFAAGAGYAWHGEAQDAADLEAQANLHIFHDEAGVMGGLMRDLGLIYQQLAHPIGNASALFRLLSQRDISNLKGAIPAGRMEQARADLQKILKRLSASAMRREDSALILHELATVIQMADFGLERGLGVSPEERAPRWRATLEDYRHQWLARNRPGGLADSIAPLEKRLEMV